MKAKPRSNSGRGATDQSGYWTLQSSRPVRGSYPYAALAPALSICIFPPVFTINGVLWALRKSPSLAIGPGTFSSFHTTERAVFQTVSPVFLSRATWYCKSAPSIVRIKRFSNEIGDDDGPR